MGASLIQYSFACVLISIVIYDAIAQSLSEYPYVFISSKILGSDIYTRIQFKLFEQNGEMLKKERIVLFNKAGH